MAENQYSIEEINAEIEVLKKTFDIVRVVNPVTCEVCSHPLGDNSVHTESCFCFDVWNKNERCKNCISSLALSQKTRLSKFEFIGDTLFYIISRYIEVGKNRYTLECVSMLDKAYSGSLFDSDDRSRKMMELYRDNRIDDLTGLYNRRYLIEKLQPMVIDARVNQSRNPVVSIMEIERFDSVVGSLGQRAGEAMIVAAADTMSKCLEQNDECFISHISGPRFAVCFGDSTAEKVKEIILGLTIEVSRTAINSYPQLKLSVCAGIAQFSEANTYDRILELAERRLLRARTEVPGRVILK